MRGGDGVDGNAGAIGSHVRNRVEFIDGKPVSGVLHKGGLGK